jgi:hypothetical protein
MDDETKYKTVNIGWMLHEGMLRYQSELLLRTGHKLSLRSLAEIAIIEFLQTEREHSRYQ